MSHPPFRFVLWAVLSLVPLVARGQAPPGAAGPAAGGLGLVAARPTVSPLMEALDADGDGTLSAREIRAATRALRVLDANKDGQLTPDELTARPVAAGKPADDAAGVAAPRGPVGPALGPAGAGLGGPVGPLGGWPGGAIGNAGGIRAGGGRGLPLDAREMRGFDRNGDGLVTQQELPEQLWNLYGRFDLNRDGKLDPAELARAQRAGR